MRLFKYYIHNIRSLPYLRIGNFFRAISTVLFLFVAIQNTAIAQVESCVLDSASICNTVDNPSEYNGFFEQFYLKKSDKRVFVSINNEEYFGSAMIDIVLFELPFSEATSFRFVDEELLDCRAHYYWIRGNQLYFPDSNAFHISRGEIFGIKTENQSWDITLDLSVLAESKQSISYHNQSVYIPCDSVSLLKQFIEFK